MITEALNIIIAALAIFGTLFLLGAALGVVALGFCHVAPVALC